MGLGAKALALEVMSVRGDTEGERDAALRAMIRLKDRFGADVIEEALREERKVNANVTYDEIDMDPKCEHDLFVGLRVEGPDCFQATWNCRRCKGLRRMIVL